MWAAAVHIPCLSISPTFLAFMPLRAKLILPIVEDSPQFPRLAFC